MHRLIAMTVQAKSILKVTSTLNSKPQNKLFAHTHKTEKKLNKLETKMQENKTEGKHMD